MDGGVYQTVPHFVKNLVLSYGQRSINILFSHFVKNLNNLSIYIKCARGALKNFFGKKSRQRNEQATPTSL